MKELGCPDEKIAAKKATQEVKSAKTSALKVATECILSVTQWPHQLF